MRTRSRIAGLISFSLLWATATLNAQVTVESNTIVGAGPFVGCDVNSTVELQVRHDGNFPIDFYTNAIQRMKLFPNVSPVINGYPALPRNGSLVLSNLDAGFMPARVPFSRLHLIDVGGNTNDNFIAAQVGFRSWMRNGVTFTGNSDQSYIGAKYGVNDFGAQLADVTDMILQWSNDVPGANGPDRLRFLYTADRVGGSTHGSNSEEGLEAMRFTPIDNATINAGLGDFYRGNLLDPTNVVEPTERLDILNGRLRIRELPLVANQNETLNRYMVVDDNGVVQWRTIAPGSIGTNSCEWELNSGTFQMATAYRPSTTPTACTDRRWRLGVGIGAPVFKVDIYHDETHQSAQGGLRVQMLASGNNKTGITCSLGPTPGNSLPDGIAAYHLLTGLSGTGFGSIGRVNLGNEGARTLVYGAAGDVYLDQGTAGSVFGLSGYALNRRMVTSSITHSYGAKTRSEGNLCGSINNSYGLHTTATSGLLRNYAVFAQATACGTAESFSVYALSPGNGANDWSGYFTGKVQMTGFLYNGLTMIFSDATLKTDVTDVEDVSEPLAALQPKQYRFTEEAQARMGLPSAAQFGFIAQEVATVLPELVGQTRIAAEVDSLGNTLVEASDVYAVNYDGFIPLLVAGHQQQEGAIQEQRSAWQAATALNAQQGTALAAMQDELNEQRARLDQLEQHLAECCSRPAMDGTRDGGPNSIPKGLDNDADPTLRIVPNPFNQHTTVFYTVERAGRMQLLANSADGKDLLVLDEALREVGDYQYDWNTAPLAPGMYYVTLLLDGQPVVKKAVKVDR